MRVRDSHIRDTVVIVLGSFVGILGPKAWQLLRPLQYPKHSTQIEGKLGFCIRNRNYDVEYTSYWVTCTLAKWELLYKKKWVRFGEEFHDGNCGPQYTYKLYIYIYISLWLRPHGPPYILVERPKTSWILEAMPCRLLCLRGAWDPYFPLTGQVHSSTVAPKPIRPAGLNRPETRSSRSPKPIKRYGCSECTVGASNMFQYCIMVP